MGGRSRLGLVMTVLGAGGLALLLQFVVEIRPVRADVRTRSTILVTRDKDAGPGTLRDAIFEAARADHPVRISLHVSRIVLGSPLPPFVNPKGTVLDCSEPRCEIDARRVGGPVLDLAAGPSTLMGLAIRGAPGAGILVRAPGVRIRGMEFSDCGEAVYVAEGVGDLIVEDSIFERNETGIRLSSDVSRTVLQGNRFRRHGRAAIWAVSSDGRKRSGAPGLIVERNRFEEDRISAVLIGVASRVERNEFVGALEEAVYLVGSSTVVGNRFREGAGVGAFVDASDGALVADNEIDHNKAVAILLRRSQSIMVRSNRLHGNGYGIVTLFGEGARPNLIIDNIALSQSQDAMFVVGDSPVVRGNSVTGNRGAGIRVLDFVPRKGPRVRAAPVLQRNRFEGNALAGVVRGEYRQQVETR